MRNRRPTPGYEGRILITPENQEIAPFFARVAMADNPIDEGTPMTAETFLKTVTAGMLGLDPQEAVPDDAFQMLAAMAASGGSGSGDVGELEDLSIKTGKFTNAGAGWNTFNFPDPFDAPPQVFLQAVGFNGWVEIKEITAEGFLYQLREHGGGSTAKSGSYVTGVTFPGRTTATETEVFWCALEFNGGDL